MVINILQNWNHKYYSHSSYYKIIKYVNFEPIIYAINLGASSSSKCFLSNVLLIWLNKIISL